MPMQTLRRLSFALAFLAGLSALWRPRPRRPAPTPPQPPRAWAPWSAARPWSWMGGWTRRCGGARPAATGFIQQDPEEGQPATQRTEIRFAYDADALYVGARMLDSLGARGVHTQLTRRDQSRGGDYVQLVFDTYHDHTGRTVFTINPSGVK